MKNNPHKLARTTDPETSHEAARKVVSKTDLVRASVLSILEELGPLTHDELSFHYQARAFEREAPPSSVSGIRSRCSELVERGRVEPVGVSVSRMGNRAKLWGAVSS